jgi:hypothetical protein
MSGKVVSCCFNTENKAWLTYSDSTIWGINDVNNPNSVWGRISGGLIQITCCSERRGDNDWGRKDSKLFIGGVNIYGAVYFAWDGLFTSPNWQQISKAPSSKYMSIAPDGRAFILTNDNRILLSTNRLDWNPDWDINIAIPGNCVPRSLSCNTITYNGRLSVICENNKAYSAEKAWPDNYPRKKAHSPKWDYSGDVFGLAHFGDRWYTINTDKKLYWTEKGKTTQVGSYSDYTLVSALPNNNNFLAVTENNTVVFGSKTTIYNSNISNGLSNPTIYGKIYYGNNIPVTPTLQPYKITLTSPQDLTKAPLKLLNWRNGVEYKFVSDRCNDPERSAWPYSNQGIAIETQPNVTVGGFVKRGNLCMLRQNCLTHAFGQDFDITLQSIPTHNQYGPVLNAAQAQLTPLSKIMNTTDGTMETYSFDIKNPPSFRKLEFNIPNPSDPVDIDPNIPMILIRYYQAGQLGMDVLNDYMGKYAFAPVVEDGNTIPRYLKTKGTGSMLPNVPINMWKNALNGSSFFNTGALAYCSDSNLTTPWCKEYCNTPGNNCDTQLLNFCKIGGNGLLPPGYERGKFFSTPVTQKILDDAYPKYTDPKTKDICGCFMPTDYYNLLDIKAFQDTQASASMYETLFRQGAIGGRPMCDPFTTCNATGVIPNRGDISQGTCPSRNIQNCIQNNTISVKGNATENTYQNQQMMNCVQNVTNPPVTPTPPVSTVPPSAPQVQPSTPQVQPSTPQVQPSAPKQDLPTAVSDGGPPPEPVPDRKAPPAATPPPEPVPVTKAPEPEIKAPPPEPLPPPKKTSNMTMVIIILIILLLLGGGGAFLVMK